MSERVSKGEDYRRRGRVPHPDTQVSSLGQRIVLEIKPEEESILGLIESATCRMCGHLAMIHDDGCGFGTATADLGKQRCSCFLDRTRALLPTIVAMVNVARDEHVRGFIQWVASNRAYNGTEYVGQVLYDNGVNPALVEWGEEYLASDESAQPAQPKRSLLDSPPFCRQGNSLQLHTGPCGPGCEYPKMKES